MTQIWKQTHFQLEIRDPTIDILMPDIRLALHSVRWNLLGQDESFPRSNSSLQQARKRGNTTDSKERRVTWKGRRKSELLQLSTGPWNMGVGRSYSSANLPEIKQFGIQACFKNCKISPLRRFLWNESLFCMPSSLWNLRFLFAVLSTKMFLLTYVRISRISF